MGRWAAHCTRLPKGDQIYPTPVFEMLPAGIRGLVLIGFVAAMTSVLTSTLNSAQTLVTMDLVSKLRKDMSSRQQVVSGSIAGLIIITAAAIWAPQIQKFDSIVKYFQQLLSYLAPPVVAVFMAGLFWRRATASGAFAGLISGLLISVSLVFGIRYTPMAHWHFLYVAPLVFMASLAIVVSVSLATAAPAPERVNGYVWQKSVFTAESRQLATMPWFKNYRVLSLMLLAAAVVFIFIWR
jgi:SSS family solute:Na+ symporter